MTKGIDYNNDQNELLDFADWIAQFQASDKFINITNEFFDIEQKLLTEPVGKKRTALVNRRSTILDNYV